MAPNSGGALSRLGILNAFEATAKHAAKALFFARRERGEHFGLNHPRLRGGLAQYFQAARREYQAVDARVGGMRLADEIPAFGELRNRQAHVLRSDRGDAGQVGGGKRSVPIEFGESGELEQSEIHLRQGEGHFVFDSVGHLGHLAAEKPFVVAEAHAVNNNKYLL